MKGSWQIVTTRRKGRLLPTLSKWETLDKNVWFLIIDHLIGPKSDYMSSYCAEFSLAKIPKSARNVLCANGASKDMVLGALCASIPHGKAWTRHQNVIYGKFTNIYLLRCVSRRLCQVVDAYNASIGFYFSIGPTPSNGGYYTPESYWKSVHNGFCPLHCVCRRRTIK